MPRLKIEEFDIDPPDEVWKDVVGFEGDYVVSNYGRVFRLSRTVPMKFKSYLMLGNYLNGTKTTFGYIIVYLYKDNISTHIQLHRLLALLFIPNPYHKPQVNHINGIKNDNRLENLEWCTNSENQIHAYRLGLHKKRHIHGELNSFTKISNQQIIDIKLRIKNGEEGRSLAKEYNISESLVSGIKNNKKRIYG